MDTRPNVDESVRKEGWRLWWDRKGKFSHPIVVPKCIEKPERSPLLAEYIGILMGDGGISAYQVTCTLNKVTDREYADYVTKLTKELFGATPSQYVKEGALVLVASRVELVRFLVTQGLPQGNKLKQGLDIPAWVLENDEYLTACIRGLMDTDGCVVIHTYKSKGKSYTYKKLEFTTASPQLQQTVHTSLTRLGMKSRLYRQYVWLDSRKDVATYFDLIGSHNPKHLNRYRS